ncbi:Uncharacterized protein conserved in bacteria [Leminorella richardii]|uniref:Uncharacterized protein conserved in bacteria n=1 Tax=Leminorella richardii TaxID=158841 RepID=A0A2X4VES8_9GAMM|nr:type VI secretion system tip protein VgrG [Leminorella richardii]SQI43800.1 Uncharacterized protein conserved in bacteria [Leminorella richardii]
MKDQLINKGKALLDEQLSAYGLGGLFGGGEGNSGGAGSSAGSATPASDGMNRYQLGIDGVGARLSILRIEGHEQLSEPWRFVVQFTAPHGLSMSQVLSKNVAIALAPGGVSDLMGAASGLSSELMSAFNAFGGMFGDKIGQAFNAPIGGFSIKRITQMASQGASIAGRVSSVAGKMGGMASGLGSAAGAVGGIAGKASGLLGSVGGALGKAGSGLSSLTSAVSGAAGALGMNGGGAFGETRALYGIVTSFSQLSTSGDEARYEVTVSPRLQLLDNTRGNAIYQNQTVPQVVEEVLRKHELTGVDFRFELAETYPVKEYLTQWEESDLTFIRRLLADSGIWFRFESHAEHGCDVVVFGDSVQQYQDGPQASYRQPTGNNDGGLEAVWDMSVARKTVPQNVITQDYNYRAAQSGMKSDVNEQKKDATTRGQYYLYAEHYRDRGEVVQSGNEQDDLLGQFGNLLDGLGDIPGISQLSGVANSVSGAIGNVKGAIDGAAGSVTSAVGSTIGGITGGASGVGSSPVDFAGGGGSGASIGDMAGSVANSVGSAVSSTASSIGSAVSGAASSIGGAVSGAAQGIAGQAQDLMGQGTDLLNKFGFGDGEGGENGEGGEESQEPEGVGQGAWYGKLRHQRLMTEQITISGKTTLAHLAPGQILTVNGSPIAEAGGGILIVSVESIGDRSQAYQLTFTGIPYDALRPYRPALLAWPSIGGTLPARVTSPDNDQYGYMDSHGRYRVKMDFDLNDSWRKGEESLWMRRASVYAGETYGLHFPLIDGTEVAIAFTGGNPDRPYISHAMHDSRHPELVTAANHKRNVIRTPANNKLRMDDERGKEHIKVATEYGKTQLNMGHLVDAERKQRGEGFELRTDEWGAIRAGKGIFISADGQEKASGLSLEMSAALNQLTQAKMDMLSLTDAANKAKALVADIESQQSLLEQRLNDLSAKVILASAPQGIGLTSGEHTQIASAQNMTLTAGNQVDIGAIKNVTISAGGGVGLYALDAGMKLYASNSDIDIQAHQGQVSSWSTKDTFIGSGKRMVLSAQDELILVCGGGYIKIAGGKVEIGAPGELLIKTAGVTKQGPSSQEAAMKSFEPNTFKERFVITNQSTGETLPNQKYRVTTSSGNVIEGVTGEDGLTELMEFSSIERIKIELL